MARSPKKPKTEKKVVRYTYDEIKEPRTPETGHTALLPDEDLVVTLPMDNGWRKAIKVGKLSEGDERPVVVDMDPAADPVLFWAGKRSRREVPVLPLQRNEIVSESRIAQIIERARLAAEDESDAVRQGHLFADLEKTLRESDRSKRVEFYTHEEGWKNKLICGDSLHVMESLLHYEKPARQGADDLHRPHRTASSTTRTSSNGWIRRRMNRRTPPMTCSQSRRSETLGRWESTPGSHVWRNDSILVGNCSATRAVSSFRSEMSTYIKHAS